MCETYKYDGTPLATNHRKACAEVCQKTSAEDPWFGIEQEYTLLDSDERPLGWPVNGFPAPQGWVLLLLLVENWNILLTIWVLSIFCSPFLVPTTAASERIELSHVISSTLIIVLACMLEWKSAAQMLKLCRLNGASLISFLDCVSIFVNEKFANFPGNIKWAHVKAWKWATTCGFHVFCCTVSPRISV